MVGFRIIRSQQDDLVIALQGRLVSLKSKQNIATAVIGLRKIRIELNGAVDQFKRVGILSGLRRDDPQKIQRARMAGRELQGPADRGLPPGAVARLRGGP